MRAPALHRSVDSSSFDTFDDGGFLPGDRIGRPLPSTGKTILRRAALFLILAGSGWALLSDDAALSRLLLTEISAIYTAMERKGFAPSVPAAPALASQAPINNEPPARPEATDPTRLSSLSATSNPSPTNSAVPERPAASSATLAPVPPATADTAEPSASPLPPPAVDPADPYQVRAESVGLHPGLSRVLLTRLSDVDYRNAAVAIKTALAQTADDAVFVWPRQRKPELALFHVHFVQGAAAGCRRYVVKVTKDGWLTTALPMEKCGMPSRVSRKQ
jgi:hypothetical protein